MDILDHSNIDPSSQRLRLIDVYDLHRVSLSYATQAIPQIPTLSSTYKIFGPTYPGTFDVRKQAYILQYPGPDVCVLQYC